MSVWISLILKLYSYWYSERLWDTRKRNLTLIRGKLKLKLVLTSKKDLKQPISEIINLLRDKVFQDFSSFKHFSHIPKMDWNISNFGSVMVCTWLYVGVVNMIFCWYLRFKRNVTVRLTINPVEKFSTPKQQVENVLLGFSRSKNSEFFSLRYNF